MFTFLPLFCLRLSTRLSIGVVGLVLASTFVITVAALLTVKQTIRSSISSEQFARLSSIGDAIDQKFISRRLLLRSFAEGARAERSAGGQPLQAFLKQHTSLAEAFQSVFVLKPNGALIASLNHPEQIGNTNLAGRPYFIDTLRNGRGVVSQPFRHLIDGTPQVVMTEPIFGPDGQLLFIIGGTINLQEKNFLGELADTRFGKTGYLFIRNTDGIVVDHPQRARILMPSDAAGGSNRASRRALDGYQGVIEATGRDGVAALYGYKRISQTNWIVASRYPSAEAFEPLRQIEQVATLGALGVALLSGSIALAVLRRQLAPLARLDEHMRAVQAAPVHVPMPTTFGEDEIGDLARTLDSLLCQRQASADQLLANGRFLNNLADNLPVLIAYLDTERRYRFVNSTFISWTGADAANVLGKTMEEVVGPIRYAERLDPLNGAFDGLRMDFEVRIDAAGAPQHVQTSYVPDLRPDGSVAGVYCLASDVSAQKQIQDKLRDLTKEARHANLAKSQFLANMSHEIRTPMNAVIGLTYLLGQSVLDDRQADMVGKLGIAGKSLLGVINDVLDLSKIEAGELTLEREPFALGAVLEGLRGLMALQASAKGVALTIEVPKDLPVAFEGDGVRLGQILSNLIANAVKFTDHGSVNLDVSWRQEMGSDAAPIESVARLILRVRDSGIGIAPEVQSRLFSPFVQADSSTRRRFGGTGLGLSIVKRLVSLMGGSVALESTLGVGSVFTVELALPMASALALAQATPATPASCDLRGLRVLITDDSEINLEVASRILILHGAEVTTARHGRQAVDLLARRADAFDLVLMDLQMPVLSGYEAARQIRNQLGLRHLPIIALSAGAFSNEHESAGAAGMNDFLSKPFEAQTLVRTVWHHARAVSPLAGVGLLAVAASTSEPRPGVPAGAAWPEIEGIDSADVRARLAGDLSLFGAMLRRLLDEFAGVGAGSTAVDLSSGPALGRVAAQMHKLKGSASTLGATAISRLAGLAESACRSGDSASVLVHSQELASQLTQLCASAAMKLDQWQVVGAADLDPPGMATELDPQQLQSLITCLEQHDIKALDGFRELAPDLRRQLGASAFLQLQELFENLQFADASDVLQPLCRSLVAHGDEL